MQDLSLNEELSLEDSLAKTYPWLASVLVWLEREAVFFTKSPGLLTRLKPNGSSSKMYLAYSAVSEEQTWEQLSERWSNSGMAWPGECLMHSTSEFPKDGGVSSSLRNVLETQPVLQKFYLSARACEGILRRAERRGKKLPEMLERALRNQCSSPSEKESQGGGKGPLISIDQSLTLATQNSQVLYEPIVNRMIAFGQYAEDDETSSSLKARDYKDATDLVIEPTLYEPQTFVKVIRSGARDAEGNLSPEVWREEQTNPTLNKFDQGDSRTVVAIVEPTVQTYPINDGREVEKHQNGSGIGNDGDSQFTISAHHPHAVAIGTVRRLTPTECERLQGFPDGWTSQRIDEKKGLINQANSSRYKQTGNAVAVPCVEWIMSRLVERET
jgi:site-specific DNA-cytosine methylase